MRKALTLVLFLAVLVAAGCGPEEKDPSSGATPPGNGPSTTAPSNAGPSSEAPPTAGPAGGGGSLELAKKYAPLVRMGQGEKNLPIDAVFFIKSSELRWNRDDRCDDTLVDRTPTPEKLADPNAYRAQKTVDGECDQREGREYNTTERTRPFANKETLGKEGYFLDSLNFLHEAGKVTGENAAPAYVEYVEGTEANQGKTAYIYWFFYPYNTWTNPTPGAKGKGGNHEGDWERITVVVGASGKPEGVVFSQHDTKCRMDFAKVAGKDGHPVAYSATGTHGSYPIGDARYKIESLPPALKALGMLEDRTSSRGQTWQTWLDLKEVQREPWWGYAGGWGEVGGPIGAGDLDKHQTGPEGPNPIKHTEQMAKEAFTTDTCPEPVSRDVPQDDKQAVIKRVEYYLHALGRKDPSACSIAAPKFRPLCLFAFEMSKDDTSEQESKVLRTIKIDPDRVRKVSDKRYEFPPSSLLGKTSMDGALVMIKLKKQWYLTDEKGAR
ncbi:Vps62-related protein [Microlunatus sp. GCM10028923]|uniref:Vps62-related protein n=1 Tax=Microlunatus sp. GCM10028923 TaxID=3273400 RepID=UPI003614F29C